MILTVIGRAMMGTATTPVTIGEVTVGTVALTAQMGPATTPEKFGVALLTARTTGMEVTAPVMQDRRPPIRRNHSLPVRCEESDGYH